MGRKTIVKLIIMVISVIAAASLVWYVFVRPYKASVAQKTHERIVSYIDNDLSYEEASYDKYIADINELINLPYITNFDKGHLYERMAQIYKFKEDTLSFYHTLGNALYYLNKSEDKSIAVNIYEDIANYHLSDCNFEQAELYMDKAFEICPLEYIDDPQVRCYAYRMQAIMMIHNRKPDEANRMIDISTSILPENEDAVWHNSYVAINDMIYAALAYEKGQYNDATALLDKHKDSEFFSSPVYADITTRDFVLPYYDVACKLAAEQGDEQRLLEYLNVYKSYSERFGFMKKELNLLLEISNGQYTLSDKTLSVINKRILANYDTIVTTQRNDYAALISEPLESGIHEQEELNASLAATRRKNKLLIIRILITLFVLLIIITILSRSLRDPLTGVGNRRRLNYFLLLGFLSPHKVSFIMMDIDDFKHVNDNYGHDKGDDVLKRIGTLLKMMQTSQNKAFRYGGEEFVMIIYNHDPAIALRIAENIRRDVQWQKWDFMDSITISVGVSSGRLNQDTLVEADKNLYHSKKNGKNAVSYTIDGEPKVIK